MTPEEAIEMLRGMQNKKVDYAEMVCDPAFAYGYEYIYPEPEDYAIEEAVKALKEIQQYRKIGTVEECKLAMEYWHYLRIRRCGVDGVVEKCMEYEQIGTVEECREAMEKQKPKKRIYPKTALERYYHAPECPNCKIELQPQICGYTLSQAIGIYSYCPWCGQNLEGGEESEGE